MAEELDEEHELSRDLSLFHVTMLGVGMMIGAGVFVLTGIGIGISGSGGILIAFALNGIIALTCTMAYAELSSAMPEAGGGYSFVREGLGGILAFLSGWMSWLGHAVAGSLYAITFSTYGIHFLEGLGMISAGASLHVLERAVAVGIAILFIYINYKGASEIGTAGTAIAIGQMAVLGAIGAMGAFIAFQDPSKLTNFSPFLPQGWGKVLVTMGFTYIGFEGYEVIAQAGEEVENPRKNIPKAIFYSLFAVVTIYLLVGFAAVLGTKPEGVTVLAWFSEHGATGFAKAIGNLFPFGGFLVAIAAIFSSTSALNATTYSSTRVSFAMGRDGYLPKKMSHISKKRKIPDIALLLSGAIIIFVAAVLPVEGVAASADITFMILFLLVNVSVIKIRQGHSHDLDYGYMIPLFPLIPIISIFLHIILAIWLFDMGLLAWASTIIWVAIGLALYKGYSEEKAEVEEEKVRVLKEKRAERERKHQVMVAVTNPENAGALMKHAEVIARKRNAEILVLSMVTVPEQTPISEAEKFAEGQEEALEKAMEEAPEDIPVHRTIRYGHDIPRGIISAVKEHDSDLLVMGCEAKFEEKGHTLGSKVDPIVEKAICDSLVIKLGESEVLKENIKIVCSVGEGPHAPEVVELARIYAETFSGKVTLYHALSEDEEADEIQDYLESLLESEGGWGDAEIDVKPADGNAADSIVEEAREFDLVMMGATEEGLFEKLLFGTVSEEVAQKSEKTVMLVKKHQGVKSWIRRWLGR